MFVIKNKRREHHMYGANFERSHRCGRNKNHRGEFDRDPGFGGPRGFGGHGKGRGGRGGRRARRGDIRLAILLLLDEEPRNGYGLMQEVEERSGGVWRPSPGSVYPAMSQLEDEGLVEATQHEGRKAFQLTDEGKSHVEKNRKQMGTPWKTVGEGASSEIGELREAAQALAMAAMQVAQTGNAEQLKSARTVIDEARRSLYRILAGDTPVGKETQADA